MGVPGLWDVLRPAGKMRSLTHLSVKDGFEANPDGKRGFRVGIDASIWFYHATYGREGENPELRTLFFRCTRLMSMPFLPLFVFDGPKRPEIKRGKRVSGKNHWMVQGMQEIIAAFGFEWRMAPGEAEAELAYLNRIGVIDAVLSDDVDTFLFGAKMVVRNPSTNLSGNRNHSLKNAAGKDDGNHVMTYAASDILARDDIQLTQGGLILIGVLRGGDYSDGLRGCGVQTAHGLAKAGFGDTLLRAARTLSRDDLEAFLVGWREDIRKELKTNAKGCLQRKCVALAKTIPEDFPDVELVLAYTNPVTSEAKGRAHRNANVDWDKEPDLGRIAGLCEMYFEWGVREVIIKRFRTVLWLSAVLRILRRAAILKDRKEARAVSGGMGHQQLPPETPRKNGKERRAPPGTPSSMIAKHFSSMALNSPQRGGADEGNDGDAEDEDDPLIVKIHSSRQHASTDMILEYRLEIAPAQLVRLCEAGMKGLRTALPPDFSDEDDDEDDDDDEGGGKKKGKKGKKPPPDPDSHLRLWLPACMVAMVEPEMVDEFEGVQKWKAEKKAAKGKKVAAPVKATAATATAAKKTKAKVPAVVAVAEEEEESSDQESEPPLPPKPKTSKAKTGTSASVGPVAKSQNKPTNKAGARKPSAIRDTSKIDEFFTAKKITSKVAAAKPAKAAVKSSTSRVPDLFKDISSDSDEEPRTFKRPLPALQKTSSTTRPSLSKISTASKSGSSRILSFLDSQSQHPPISPSKASASSLSKARAPQPFPMDFDAFPLNKPSDPLATDADEDLFTPGAGPSSQSSSRAHTRTRSTLSSSSSDTRPFASAPVHKSPRRSEKHSSPRNTPRKDRDRKAQQTPRKEEEEESSGSDSDSALGRRPPSPSPLKGQNQLSTALGSRTYRLTNARREEEEEEESDRGPSSSLTRWKKLVPLPASSKALARPKAARKLNPPTSLPADMTIISISSGSEPDDFPPPKPSTKVAPLELARARLSMVSDGDKPSRRAYDPDDIIDLT
ncbi:hypothetical protein LXA43DRAFT_946919 [Ganoderma leucocontextum]|nr:hypothetical protein LXA43DRAFT_946919 [Ganoderma leucocontextum]